MYFALIGDGQELDDISSGDEEDDDVDGIEMGGPQQICEDLDCDHTIPGYRCKSLQNIVIKTPKTSKKKVKKKTFREWASDSYEYVTSSIHYLFCISTKDLLGKWRFTRSLTWYSTPEYNNRLLMINSKVA